MTHRVDGESWEAFVFYLDIVRPMGVAALNDPAPWRCHYIKGPEVLYHNCIRNERGFTRLWPLDLSYTGNRLNVLPSPYLITGFTQWSQCQIRTQKRTFSWDSCRRTLACLTFWAVCLRYDKQINDVINKRVRHDKIETFDLQSVALFRISRLHLQLTDVQVFAVIISHMASSGSDHLTFSVDQLPSPHV